MGRIAAIILILTGLYTVAGAQQPEAFDQAKALSAELGKPVLLEFVHED